MSDLLEICKKGQLSGRDDENPHMRSSSAARAWTAGTLLDGAPTACKTSRGHTLVVSRGQVAFKFDFKDSEKSPQVSRL